jgi:kexin
MDAPPQLVADAFIDGSVNGRNGKESLFVFASGNGGSSGDNWYLILCILIISNFDGYTNSILTITIGAIDRYNNHPSYSEECSAQLAVTYSSGSGGHILTTDWPSQVFTFQLNFVVHR